MFEFTDKSIMTDYSLIGSIIGSITVSILWFRKKLSGDALDIKKDDVAVNILQHLEDERDVLKADNEKLIQRIIIIEGERNEANVSVGKLSLEVRYLTEKVQELKILTESLIDKLEHATDNLHAYALKYTELVGQIQGIKNI
jgi:hypothetical protein